MRHNQKVDCHHQLLLFVKSIICNAKMRDNFYSDKFLLQFISETLYRSATFGIIFPSIDGVMQLKKILLVQFLFISAFATAQKVDNIFVNLYTDSLKKGTYNYINIDGQLSNGTYMPLDSTDVIFWASEGKFYGNNLWVEKGFKNEKVFIKVVLKGNPQINKEFTMYIKKKPDDEKLRTSEEILDDMNKSKRKKKN